MNMRSLLGIVVCLAILGVGGYYAYTFTQKPKPQTYIVCPTDLKQCAGGLSVSRVSPRCEFAICPEDRPKGSGGIVVSPPEKVDGAFNGSINDLRLKGGDYICAFATGTDMNGTLYFSQSDLSADIVGTAKKSLHLIISRKDIVLWGKKQGKGISMNQDYYRADPSAVWADTAVDPEKPYDFTCSSTPRIIEKYDRPTDVEFQELSVASSTPL